MPKSRSPAWSSQSPRIRLSPRNHT